MYCLLISDDCRRYLEKVLEDEEGRVRFSISDFYGRLADDLVCGAFLARNSGDNARAAELETAANKIYDAGGIAKKIGL